MHFQDISIGRSSWPTNNGSRTISIATRQTTMGCRGAAMHCCKVLLFAAAAVAGWGCIIPARTAAIRSMCVALTSINMAGRAARRCALGIDGAVERLLLEALTPDRLALAIAALGELENEARALEHQWSLKRERARYEAERARRQYDAVEPENRLVARSLERVGGQAPASGAD